MTTDGHLRPQITRWRCRQNSIQYLTPLKEEYPNKRLALVEVIGHKQVNQMLRRYSNTNLLRHFVLHDVGGQLVFLCSVGLALLIFFGDSGLAYFWNGLLVVLAPWGQIGGMGEAARAVFEGDVSRSGNQRRSLNDVVDVFKLCMRTACAEQPDR